MDEAETPDGLDQTAVATAEAVAPQTPHGPRRPLRRRAGHRLFAGVAGGLADYAGVRPMVFRLAFVLFTVAGGLGLLIYLLLWWVVPREDLPDSAGERLLRRFPNAPSWAGIGLLMLGAVLLAGQFGLWRPNVLWAFLLIGLGVVLFKRDAERQAPERPRAALPVERPVTAGGLERPAMFEPLPEPRPPRPRSSLGWLTFGGMLLALGMAAVLDNLGAIRPWVGQYPSLALGILGAGLVVGAWWGRARSLILLGLLLVPVVLAGSLVRVPLEGPIGDVYEQPQSLGQVRSQYRVLAGSLALDLTRLDLQHERLAVDATIGMGDITVIVPRDLRVEVVGNVGAGDASVGRHWQSGFDLTIDRALGSEDGDGLLLLDLDSGIGTVSVYRAGPEEPRDRKKQRDERKGRQDEEA